VIIDQFKIHVRAGNGGNGSDSILRREALKSMSWGGDGGRGASIFLKVSPHLYDLSKFKGKKRFKADDGKHGSPNNKTGKSARDLFIDVPLGTLVRDESGNLLADLCDKSSEFLIAKSGLAGKGNYKKAFATQGQEGELKIVILDYRIPNDAALLGLPNSGKTSLFNKLTKKEYKVAEYPFTTNTCFWADSYYEYEGFSIMDIPALYPYSHEERGLGNGFLKHLYRSKIILLLSDDLDNLKEHFKIVKDQINRFDPKLLQNKKFFYLLTKADKIDVTVKGSILPISVINDLNIAKLKIKILKTLKNEKASC